MGEADPDTLCVHLRLLRDLIVTNFFIFVLEASCMVESKRERTVGKGVREGSRHVDGYSSIEDKI